ncbi:hypothetical protein HPB48_021408 [Haemaphysalis longicornis]|uniref:Uncharacterized protein n=1 Tax=Haemaphysalis longicornis TaxID=44386 RepID=A0A9J6FLZ7_HAELO|nr:hypothetical protein HPB48_021408 [Haemaphysalis longicornis]
MDVVKNPEPLHLSGNIRENWLVLQAEAPAVRQRYAKGEAPPIVRKSGDSSEHRGGRRVRSLQLLVCCR